MKTIFFDVDTQIDFLFPAGALYVPGAEKMLPRVAELNRRAPLVISTMCTHSENDAEFRVYPHHCVAGTVGQQKPAITLCEKRCTLRQREDSAQQWLLEKTELDCFSNPLLRPLLADLGAERYVVYGVVTEICVQRAVFGLLEVGGRVELVTDAVTALDESAARQTFEEFVSRGGVLTSTAAVLA
jgi:nicotinamidase/pyrazinamidase